MHKRWKARHIVELNWWYCGRLHYQRRGEQEEVVVMINMLFGFHIQSEVRTLKGRQSEEGDRVREGKFNGINCATCV